MANVCFASGEGNDENWHHLIEFFLHSLHLYLYTNVMILILIRLLPGLFCCRTEFLLIEISEVLYSPMFPWLWKLGQVFTPNQTDETTEQQVF